jgi:hypothetical protein
MFKSLVVAITLISFSLATIGCYASRPTTFENFGDNPNRDITSLVTTEGDVIEFKTKPTIDIENSLITGISKYNLAVSIPFADVRTVYVKKLDPATTILAVIGISALVALVALAIIALMKESCPFVYSFNGENYVFDGEPYGGAICEALQRTDLCRLEHLRPVDDEYRLLLTNEVNETQYTDEFKLWVVDHPKNVDVIADATGELHTVESLIAPLTVRDSKGVDLHRWLSDNDLLYWESDVLAKNPENPADLRDTILLTFPKPDDASNAKLVVHGCNTLWGSQMLRRMAELAGDQVELWYESLRLPAQKERRAAWNDLEEVFELQVHIWTGNAWEKRGEIMGGGPFMAEERVVPLDVTDIEGDEIRIRLTPPTGFWKLNSLRIDYSDNAEFELQEVSANAATDDNGEDVRALLEDSDHNYHIMPETGQRASLVFPVPPAKAGLKRTLFAKVAGYYDMHLDATGPPQFEIANRLRTEPGFVAKFALEEYFKWRSERLALAGE